MTKRIAFIIEKFADFSTGGEPSIHSNCIKYFLNKGYSVDIFCEINQAKTNNYNVFSDFIKNQKEYIKKINNYDLIIASKFGLKFSELTADIYTIHSHSDLYSQKTKYGLFYYLLRPRQKRIKNEIKNLKLRTNKKFIFCSKQLKEDYCKICELKNTFVIEPYPNWTPNEGYVKKKNDIFTFGLSATGFQNKGGYLVLKSAFLLKLYGKNFKIKIIYKKNGGFLQNFLVKILGLEKQIEFLSEQKDMHNFYESIDCLLMPSKLESFGMAAIEALSFEIPVILSSACGSKELIYDGVNGFVFKFNFFRVWNLFLKMKRVMEKKNFIPLKKVSFPVKINDKDAYNIDFEKIIGSNL